MPVNGEALFFLITSHLCSALFKHGTRVKHNLSSDMIIPPDRFKWKPTECRRERIHYQRPKGVQGWRLLGGRRWCVQDKRSSPTLILYCWVGPKSLQWDFVTGQISIRGRGWQVKESGTGVLDADWIKNDRCAFIRLSGGVSHLLRALRRDTPVRKACRVYWCLDMCVIVEMDLCRCSLWKIYEMYSAWVYLRIQFSSWGIWQKWLWWSVACFEHILKSVNYPKIYCTWNIGQTNTLEIIVIFWFGTQL